MENNQKIVDFEYCSECEHFMKKENEDPCQECLSIFTNAYSHKPKYFKEKEVKK